MKFFKNLLIAVFFLSYSQAFAAVSFEIDDSDVPKTKIMFYGFDSDNPDMKADISEILFRIDRNLKSTNLFEVVEQKDDIASDEDSVKMISPEGEQKKPVKRKASVADIEKVPDFEKYNKLGVGAVAIASFNYNSKGALETRVRFWDVLDQRQLFGKFYSASKNNYKKMSNLISDEIFKSITGEKAGHFNSKILYVAESGNIRRRTKRIAFLDFDGENRTYLTNGKNLVLTPIFSRKPNEIFYLSYFSGRPQIYAMDVLNRKNKKVGNFSGTTFAPATHPKDPNIMLLSAIIDGNSDIYEMNILTNTARRLTKHPGIDTTPAFSPDAKFITFASDRHHGQQLYAMDVRGDEIRRISFGRGAYSKPVWSPDGSLIAFTKMKSGQFHVGVMSPNNKGERILASGYLLEGVKWSPNGRFLIYSKKKAQFGKASVPRLYVVDIVTGYEYEVPTPKGEGATDPDWI